MAREKHAEAGEARAKAEIEEARAKSLREEQAERARVRDARAEARAREEEKRKEEKRKADREAMMQQTPLRSQGSRGDGMSLEELNLCSPAPAPALGTGAESFEQAMELHQAAELLASPSLKALVDPKTEQRLRAKVDREEREKTQVATWMQGERDIKERILDDNAHHKAMIGLLQHDDLPDKLSQYIDHKDLERTIARLSGELNRLTAENRIAEVKLTESMASSKEELSAARRAKIAAEGLVRVYKRELLRNNLLLPSEGSLEGQAEGGGGTPAALKASSGPGLLKKTVAIVICFLVIRQLLFQATSTMKAPICFY